LSKRRIELQHPVIVGIRYVQIALRVYANIAAALKKAGHAESARGGSAQVLIAIEGSKVGLAEDIVCCRITSRTRRSRGTAAARERVEECQHATVARVSYKEIAGRRIDAQPFGIAHLLVGGGVVLVIVSVALIAGKIRLAE
jgi:hypothetical protein